MATQPDSQLTQITDGSETVVLSAASSATDKTVVKPCNIVVRVPSESDVNVLLYQDDGTTKNELHKVVLNSSNGYTWVSPFGVQWTDNTTTLKADPSNSTAVHITVGYARQT